MGTHCVSQASGEEPCWSARVGPLSRGSQVLRLRLGDLPTPAPAMLHATYDVGDVGPGQADHQVLPIRRGWGGQKGSGFGGTFESPHSRLYSEQFDCA